MEGVSCWSPSQQLPVILGDQNRQMAHLAPRVGPSRTLRWEVWICPDTLPRHRCQRKQREKKKTMWEPEVTMASRSSSAGGARVLMVSEVDVTGSPAPSTTFSPTSETLLRQRPQAAFLTGGIHLESQTFVF